MYLFLKTAILGSEPVTLTEHFHHLVRVRRASVGEVLRCVDTTGQAWEVRMVRIASESYTLEPLRALGRSDLLPALGVAFGNIQSLRISMLIEKCTEIGVQRFYPLITERTQRQYCDLERMARVATSAAQQSQRLCLPRIEKIQPLLALAVDDSWGIAVPGAHGMIDHQVRNVMIGPEGGWSKQEVEQCLGRGVRAVGLGPTVLRTETACIVAATLMAAQHYCV